MPGEGMKSKVEKLPNAGLDVLTQFITHQDIITWTAFSIALSAEFALWGVFATSTNLRTNLYVAAAGLIVTVAAYLVEFQSTRYLHKFVNLALARAQGDDREIFSVRTGNTGPFVWLSLVYMVFAAAWASAMYLLLPYMRIG